MKKVYYHSRAVIEQFMDKKNKQLAGVELTSIIGGIGIQWDNIDVNIARKFIKKTKDFKLINELNKNEWSVNEYYKFSCLCSLKEEFSKLGTSSIKVCINVEDTILSGYTSIANWISESYLNNLLSIENVEMEGIIILLDKKELSNESNQMGIQFVLIGEKGVLDDK